jgi:hypothetical protein
MFEIRKREEGRREMGDGRWETRRQGRQGDKGDKETRRNTET